MLVASVLIVSLISSAVFFYPLQNPNGLTIEAKITDNVFLQYRQWHNPTLNQTLVNEGWKPLGYNGEYYVYNFTVHNKVVNVMGLTWLSNKLFTSAYENTTTIAQYIGVSADSTATAFTDTNLPAEITTNGLGRALCTTSIGTASAGAITDQCVITFTDTTASTSNVQKAGWFINSIAHCVAGSTATTPETTGCLFAENTFGSTTLNVNDQLQLTWKATFTSS